MSIKDNYDIYGIVDTDKVKPFSPAYGSPKYYMAKNKTTGHWGVMSLDFELSGIDNPHYNIRLYTSFIKNKKWGKIN